MELNPQHRSYREEEKLGVSSIHHNRPCYTIRVTKVGILKWIHTMLRPKGTAESANVLVARMMFIPDNA